MNCKHCDHACIKKGKRNGIQRYRCKRCKKYQQSEYRYHAYCNTTNARIVNHIKEGCGVRSIGRLLQISPVTVITRTLEIASAIDKPVLKEQGQVYEIDELYTFIASKENETYIIYAINKVTKCILDFRIGGRTKENLGKVVGTLLELSPEKICTDGLNAYPGLIPKPLHRTRKGSTNRIERHNLTLRTHLKRLCRKTICFSRSVAMLVACLKIYFWG